LLAEIRPKNARQKFGRKMHKKKSARYFSGNFQVFQRISGNTKRGVVYVHHFTTTWRVRVRGAGLKRPAKAKKTKNDGEKEPKIKNSLKKTDYERECTATA